MSNKVLSNKRKFVENKFYKQTKKVIIFINERFRKYGNEKKSYRKIARKNRTERKKIMDRY